MSDKTAIIKAGLARLDVNDDTHWTKGGLPDVAKTRDFAKMDALTRDELETAVPGYNRTNAAAAPSDLSNAGNIPEGGPAAPPVSDDEGHGYVSAAPRVYEPTEIAAHIPNPITLIEAAIAATNANDRYRKNGELQAFLRHYMVAQSNIKAHQDRLDKRYAAVTGSDG